MPQLHFTPGKDPVPILQEAGWVPGPVWIGGKSRPDQDSIPDRLAHSQSLYRLSYPAQMNNKKVNIHCDEGGNILNSLNNSLRNSLYSHPIMTRINLFCILKITELCDKSPQNIMP